MRHFKQKPLIERDGPARLAPSQLIPAPLLLMSGAGEEIQNYSEDHKMPAVSSQPLGRLECKARGGAFRAASEREREMAALKALRVAVQLRLPSQHQRRSTESISGD